MAKWPPPQYATVLVDDTFYREQIKSEHVSLLLGDIETCHVAQTIRCRLWSKTSAGFPSLSPSCGPIRCQLSQSVC